MDWAVVVGYMLLTTVIGMRMEFSILVVAWVRPELRQLLASLGANDIAEALLASRPGIADP